MGAWVRFDRPTPSPNHSWRHRLKTLCRRHGLAIDLANAITGHLRKTVADGYGEYPPEALYRELVKIRPLAQAMASGRSESGIFFVREDTQPVFRHHVFHGAALEQDSSVGHLASRRSFEVFGDARDHLVDILKLALQTTSTRQP